MSFLRRTEYIATSKKRAEAEARRTAVAQKVKVAKRKSPEPDAGTPAYVKRKIEKSFDAAALALTPAMRAKAVHPSKRKTDLVEILPILPDLDAFPDSGAYVTVKFMHGPLPSSSGNAGSSTSKYDTRLLSSVFRPIAKSASEEAAFEAAKVAHQLDPERNPAPPNNVNYDLFLADTIHTADNFRAKYDVDNPNRDDDGLYTANLSQGRDGRCFRFNRVRGYETAEEKEMTHQTKYDEELIISCGKGGITGAGEGDGGPRPRAAWYYPVMQRTVVRNQRTKSMARMQSQGAADDDQQVDALDLMVTDPTEAMLELAARIRADPLHFAEDDGAEEHEAEEGQTGAHSDDEGRRSSSPAVRRPVRDGDDDAEGDADGHATPSDAEEDAEGDEEED